MSNPTMTASASNAPDQEIKTEWFRDIFECLNDAVFIHDIAKLLHGHATARDGRACDRHDRGI